MPEISIIIPVFNEAENIKPLFDEIRKYTPENFELIFVDDGSTDATFPEIQQIAEKDNRVKCISFSRNFGHQNAFMAGLEYAKGNYIITMDGDLQHPVALIPTLLKKLAEGKDIVFTKKNNEIRLPLFKKVSASIFYKLLNFLSDVSIEPGVSDFRAFNRAVLESVLQFHERELFLKGIFSWVGYNSCTITFTPQPRLHGKTKYSVSKMFKLGIKGAISFSIKPLRLSLLAGTFISLVAFGFACFAFVSYFRGNTIPGWASMIITIMLMGGIQLLVMGLVGEYIAGIFSEVKKRPVYIVKQSINI